MGESEGLRHAVNMAAGFNITPPLPVSCAVQGERAVEYVINVVRGSLQSTDFEIEDVRVDRTGASVLKLWNAGASEKIGQQVCGLLVYEPPGLVSPDAPGHWVAIRHLPQSHLVHSAGDVSLIAGDRKCWRLDPVRGSYQLTMAELGDLVRRYRIWRVVRGQRSP